MQTIINLICHFSLESVVIYWSSVPACIVKASNTMPLSKSITKSSYHSQDILMKWMIWLGLGSFLLRLVSLQDGTGWFCFVWGFTCSSLQGLVRGKDWGDVTAKTDNIGLNLEKVGILVQFSLIWLLTLCFLKLMFKTGIFSCSRSLLKILLVFHLEYICCFLQQRL